MSAGSYCWALRRVLTHPLCGCCLPVEGSFPLPLTTTPFSSVRGFNKFLSLIKVQFRAAVARHNLRFRYLIYTLSQPGLASLGPLRQPTDPWLPDLDCWGQPLEPWRTLGTPGAGRPPLYSQH